MKVNKIVNLICAFLFCLVVAYIFLSNFSYITNKIVPQFENIVIRNDKNLTNQLELDYHNTIHEKNILVDFYGIFQNLLQKKVIGNFDFYKDDAGLMHQFNNYIDVQDSANEIALLSQKVKEKGIPFLYVQIPARESNTITSYPASIYNQNSEMIDKAIKLLKEKNVDCLKIDEVLTNTQFNYNNLFFHTDLHLQTDAEIWMASQIINIMVNKYKLSFQNKDKIFNMENYNKETYEFIGNLARSSGKYFSGTDFFDEYIPKFDTSMIMDDSIQGIYREGTFDSTVMNQYSKNLYLSNKEYTYWVTDYMQFTSPYYTIKNNDVLKNNILVIMDSLAYRSFSYISLASANLTILDPRFYNGVDYTSMVLNNSNFDAVIFCHSTSLFGYSIFPKQEISDLPVIESKSGTNMCIDFYNGEALNNQNVIMVKEEKNTITLSGWVADLDALKPARKVYINIDGYIVNCNYGIYRRDMEDYFKSESMGNCGFTVSIPTSILINSKTGALEFHIISADGNNKYMPVIYQIENNNNMNKNDN